MRLTFPKETKLKILSFQLLSYALTCSTVVTNDSEAPTTSLLGTEVTIISTYKSLQYHNQEIYNRDLYHR